MSTKIKKWTMPHPSIVLECIESWRNIDLRKLSDNDIDQQLSQFLNKLGVYTVHSLNTRPFKLWRIRRFDYLFKEINECWEPPKNKTAPGRCNAKGSPVLYTSEDLETPFEELDIRANEQVYAIKYEAIEDLNVKRIIPKDFIEKDENGNPLYDSESMISYQILREFVRSEFLRPVGKGTEYLHKISSAMCRVWFHSDESDGWIYPSVQTPSKNNFALKPESARKKLKINSVRIVRLVEKEHVKNHIDKFKSHPFYNLISMAIETDFKGEIKGDCISWKPSTEIGGIF